MGIKNLILLTYLITLSGAVFPSLAAAIPYGITGHVKVYAAPHDTIERNTGGTLPVISLDDSLADQGPVLNTSNSRSLFLSALLITFGEAKVR